MKIEWLIVNVTPVRSPDRAEREMLGMIVDVFGLVSRLCIWEFSLEP